MEINNLSADAFLKFANTTAIKDGDEFTQENITKLTQDGEAKEHAISLSQGGSKSVRNELLGVVKQALGGKNDEVLGAIREKLFGSREEGVETAEAQKQLSKRDISMVMKLASETSLNKKIDDEFGRFASSMMLKVYDESDDVSLEAGNDAVKTIDSQIRKLKELVNKKLDLGTSGNALSMSDVSKIVEQVRTLADDLRGKTANEFFAMNDKALSKLVDETITKLASEEHPAVEQQPEVKEDNVGQEEEIVKNPKPQTEQPEGVKAAGEKPDWQGTKVQGAGWDAFKAIAEDKWLLDGQSVFFDGDSKTEFVTDYYNRSKPPERELAVKSSVMRAQLLKCAKEQLNLPGNGMDDNQKKATLAKITKMLLPTGDIVSTPLSKRDIVEVFKLTDPNWVKPETTMEERTDKLNSGINEAEGDRYAIRTAISKYYIGSMHDKGYTDAAARENQDLNIETNEQFFDIHPELVSEVTNDTRMDPPTENPFHFPGKYTTETVHQIVKNTPADQTNILMTIYADNSFFGCGIDDVYGTQEEATLRDVNPKLMAALVGMGLIKEEDWTNMSNRLERPVTHFEYVPDQNGHKLSPAGDGYMATVELDRINGIPLEKPIRVTVLFRAAASLNGKPDAEDVSGNVQYLMDCREANGEKVIGEARTKMENQASEVMRELYKQGRPALSKTGFNELAALFIGGSTDKEMPIDIFKGEPKQIAKELVEYVKSGAHKSSGVLARAQDAYYDQSLRLKIRKDIVRARKMGIKQFVAGGLGCGQFQNDPSRVGRIYAEEFIKHGGDMSVYMTSQEADKLKPFLAGFIATLKEHNIPADELEEQLAELEKKH